MQSEDRFFVFRKHVEENGTFYSAIIASILLFISNFLFPEGSGLYMILILVVILVEVIIGAIFLIYNTTTAVLVMFLQEGLLEPEKKWVQRKIRKNSTIIGIWVIFSGATFVVIAPNLGVIASMYLIALILIFKYAGVEENPFLVKRYEIG